LGKRAHEENKLPALVLGQATFERRHGPAALGDLVKDFAIGDGGDSSRVGEIGRKRPVHPRLGAISFAVFSVTLDALVRVDLPGGAQGGLGGQKGILESFVFRGDNPGFALLIEPTDNQDANKQKKNGEKELAECEGARRNRGHGTREIFAQGRE